MPQKDIAGVVIVAFETEISVADWLVAKFSPTPIPTAASPPITHMTACRIEASLPRANQNHRNFRAGDRERGCELGHTSLLKKNAPAQGPKALRFGSGKRHPAGPLVIGLRWFGACSRSGPASAKSRRQAGVERAAFLIPAD